MLLLWSKLFELRNVLREVIELLIDLRERKIRSIDLSDDIDQPPIIVD